MLYLFGDCALDTDRRELRRAAGLVPIEPQVFDILEYLIGNRARVVSKDDLRAAIWNGRIVSDSALTTRLNAARAAIGDSGEGQHLIRTLPRKGLRFVGDVREEPREAAQPAPSSTLPDKPSVAVLPFEAMPGEADLSGFADGLSEDITTGLSRIKAILVFARSTMFTYKGRPVDIREVGRDLGAQYVLEGSVRRSGTRMRITAQLIEAASGHHIWAERMDHASAGMFDSLDEITSSIVASVQTQVILNEGKAAATDGQPTESVGRLLARAWRQFLRLTEHSLADCRSLADRALQLDGDSGMAHRMIAVALYHQAYMGFIAWDERVIEDIHSHAKIAIEAEDADEYSYWAMECAHLLRMEHERAFASLRRALDINPNCSLAHGSMGTVLAWQGRSDAAIVCNELALRMNPDDPSIFYRHFGLALAHYLASRYEQALAHAGMVLQVRPSWWLGLLVHAASLAQLGRRDEARRTLEELTRIRPGANAASLGILPFAAAHDREHLLDGLRKAGLPG